MKLWCMADGNSRLVQMGSTTAPTDFLLVISGNAWVKEVAGNVLGWHLLQILSRAKPVGQEIGTPHRGSTLRYE